MREVFQPPPSSTNGNHQVTGSRTLTTPLFDDDVNLNHRRYPESTRNQSTDGRVQNRTDQQYGIYGRTLTEKDVKHIERHLSMKKTIRKQLSRHLTQSYLDAESNNDKNSTVSNAFAKSESNFLELLKSVRSDDGRGGGDRDRDSGHCSPTEDMDLMQSEWSRNFGPKHNVVSKNNSAEVAASQEPKKSSFWKKLTVRAKIKH